MYTPASRLFTQPFIQTQIKENIKAPRHWPLCREFTGDRWIPRTNGQLRGKCFHLITSSCDESASPAAMGCFIPALLLNNLQKTFDMFLMRQMQHMFIGDLPKFIYVIPVFSIVAIEKASWSSISLWNLKSSIYISSYSFKRHWINL